MIQTKLIAGKYKYPVTITQEAGQLWFDFPNFSKTLIESIKLMQGSRYHVFETPPIKRWSVNDSPRNWFQIKRLEGKNPYERYDRPLLEFKPRRTNLYDHQVDLVQHIITRQYCIIAAEPATGKTLAAIEAMEWLYFKAGIRSWFYVAPKSALVSVRLEFEQWHSLIQPQFFTYEVLKNVIENWPKGSLPPAGVIFDESQRLKNPTSQRAQAALHLSESIIKEHGEHGAVVLMSGTPAPLAPVDWWSQTEVVCPGFLVEGDINKFRKRLAIMDQGQSASGQVFNKLITWKDNVKKCSRCGKLEFDNCHDSINMLEKSYHAFESSVNEVEKLYRRLKGLVIVKLKAECLSLPDKIFKIINCKPTQSILNAAKLIVARGGNGMVLTTLLRELSDGFQYRDIEIGTETCPICNGSRVQDDWVYSGSEEEYEKLLLAGQEVPMELMKKIVIACNTCGGAGEIASTQREAVQVPCPKEDALLDLIDQYDDVGRMVVYAGFTGSVDRIVGIFLRLKWDVVRVDGRSWWSNVPGNSVELYKMFKYQRAEHPRVAFVGQASAAGTGLNLQESPVCVFYSLDNNGESRMQALERCHRPGMDMNRGLTVVDLVHLPTDQLILDAHAAKKKLQSITMGELQESLGSEDNA